MPFSCIIVDDDLHALEQLKEYIHTSPHLVLLESFSNPVLARDYMLLLATPIDILFADVEMPLLSGLQLASCIKDKINVLILVSSHLKYAIEGYDVNAQQFLSKPFDYRKFERTVENVLPKIKPINDFIIIKLSGKNEAVKIYLKDIIQIESASNYLKVITAGKTYIPYGSLHSMQEMLSKYTNFLRISRSLIINIDFISHTSRYQIFLSNDVTVSVGESYQKGYDKYFKEIIMKNENT